MNAATCTLTSGTNTNTNTNTDDMPPRASKGQSLRLRVSLVLTALAATFVLASAALWVRDARIAITEEITAAHRVAAQ